MALGLTGEAQSAVAILANDFADDEWYADALVLFDQTGLDAAGSGAGWLARIYRQTVQGDWL